jgi:rubrerythrin
MKDIINPSEIIEIAVNLEEAGSSFYAQVAEISSETRSLFEQLSRAETKHAQLYRSLDPASDFPGQNGAFEYLTQLVDTGPLRTLRETGKMGETPLNMDEAFPLAVQFEKETILFYTGLQPLLSPEAAEINKEIIAQEKQHLEHVVSARKRLQTVR